MLCAFYTKNFTKVYFLLQIQCFCIIIVVWVKPETDIFAARLMRGVTKVQKFFSSTEGGNK